MSKESARNKRVEKAQLRVLFNVPFFAPGVAQLQKIIWDDSIPTACTDGKCIRWNPEWFDTLADEVVVTVLCHEVCHPLLGHLWRIPAGADHRQWNIACDHAVNLMLKEFGKTVTSRNMADPFPFPDPQNAYCADPKYAGMSEEAIYQDVAKNSPGGGGGASGAAGASGGSSGKSGSGKQQGGAGANGKGQNSASGSGRQPFGEFIPQNPADQDAKQDKTQWENTLMQSIAAAKGRGDVPGMMERFVDQLMNPKVPWVELVKNWLREHAEDDWDWTRPNPYFDDSGFILPSLHSERMGTAVFATDTSGSIDHRILAQFQAEKQSFLDEMKPTKLVDICCDTRITQEKEYRVGEVIDTKCPGGGGTRFEPVFDHLAKFPEKPKFAVYLTDLDGSFPDEEPDYPVLWVVYGCGNKKAPFGETIQAEA